MRYTIFASIIFLFCGSGSYAQQGFNTSIRVDGFNETELWAIEVVDSFFYTWGNVRFNTFPFEKGVLSKYTMEGDLIWDRIYGSDSLNTVADNDESESFTVTSSGNLAITGYNTNNFQFDNTFLLVCDAENGDVITYKTFEPDDQSIRGQTIIETEDGGFLISAWEYLDYTTLIRTDSGGNQIWRNNYANTIGYRSQPLSMVKDQDSYSLLIGISKGWCSEDWFYEAFNLIITIDDSGNIIWEHQAPTDELIANVNLQQFLNGDFLAAGVSIEREQLTSSLYDCDVQGYLTRISEDHDVIWDLSLGSSGNQILNHIYHTKLDENSNGIICGTNYFDFSPDSIQQNGWLAKVSPDGDSLWGRHIRHFPNNFLKRNFFTDFEILTSGEILLAGLIDDDDSSSPTVGRWGWIVKTDSLGCIEPGCHLSTSVQTPSSTQEDGLLVFPNPAREVVTLQMHHAVRAQTKIRIYNSMGQLIREEQWLNGLQQHSLNLSDCLPGIYVVVVVEADQVVHSRKIIVE
ncbi:MAG: T9SS type A sorting domain-containing protein [Bacteroidota bacterium]